MDSLRLRRLMGLAIIVVAASCLIQSTAAATTHAVGDATGWTVPSTAQFYANWASGKTFTVGDILSFSFTTSQHDVAQVTKAEYDACTSKSPIGSIITSGPANITLNSTGNHYFLCTINGHCSAGQKLAVNVVPSTTPAPSSPPSASPTRSPSTPSPAPAVPGSSPSPSPRAGVSPAPSPSPTASSAPSPSPTLSPSSGPSPSPTASSSGPSPSPAASSSEPPSGSPSSSPPVPSSGSPPPSGSDGSPAPSPPSTATSTPTTPESPPSPSSAISLRTTSRVMAVSVAILLTFFI